MTSSLINTILSSESLSSALTSQKKSSPSLLRESYPSLIVVYSVLFRMLSLSGYDSAPNLKKRGKKFVTSIDLEAFVSLEAITEKISLRT